MKRFDTTGHDGGDDEHNVNCRSERHDTGMDDDRARGGGGSGSCGFEKRVKMRKVMRLRSRRKGR